MTTPNRVQKGVSTGGQFAPENKAEAEGVSLATPAQSESRPVREWVDHAVAGIMEGPLSRGVVNKDRRAAFDKMYWATVGERTNFAEGMTDTLDTLYRHRVDEIAWEPGDEPHVLQVAGKKRTRAEDRDAWVRGLQHLPGHIADRDQQSIEEFERGRIAGALALSGLDHEYDISGPGSGDVKEEDEPNIVATVSFDGREYEIDLNDAETQHYAVYDGGEELASFSFAGDPEDHDLLQAEALQALEESGDIERCSEEDCGNSLADGEGFDGKCGDCADQAEADGDWDHWDDEEDGEDEGFIVRGKVHGFEVTTVFAEPAASLTLTASIQPDGTLGYRDHGRVVPVGGTLPVFSPKTKANPYGIRQATVVAPTR